VTAELFQRFTRFEAVAANGSVEWRTQHLDKI
jgi:hypothetical protein